MQSNYLDTLIYHLIIQLLEQLLPSIYLTYLILMKLWRKPSLGPPEAAWPQPRVCRLSAEAVWRTTSDSRASLSRSLIRHLLKIRRVGNICSLHQNQRRLLRMVPVLVDWQHEDTLTPLRIIAPHTTNHRLSNLLFWSFLRQWPTGLGTEYVTVSSETSDLSIYSPSIYRT